MYEYIASNQKNIQFGITELSTNQKTAVVVAITEILQALQLFCCLIFHMFKMFKMIQWSKDRLLYTFRDEHEFEIDKQ